MSLSIIVAVSENGVIGRDNDLPWRLPSELQLFKTLTEDSVLIMGRKTWDSLPLKPLPGRPCLVVSRGIGEDDGGVYVTSISAALHYASVKYPNKSVFIIGGSSIYAQALPIAETMYRTLVHAEVDGNVYFPEYDESAWELVGEVEHEAGPRDDHPYTTQVFSRKSA